VSINLENGKTFTVVCNNQSNKNLYIKSAKLNGKNYTKSFINYDDIRNGGIIEFEMSAKPNFAFGAEKDDIPVSRISDKAICLNPVVSPSTAVFVDSMKLSLSMPFNEQADIYFTIDGSIPDKNATKYLHSFSINRSCQVRAIAYQCTESSKVVEASFFRYQKDKDIIIKSQCSKMYDAGGKDALVDNQRGKPHFALGGWQGYQGQDFEAIIDLRTVKPITELGAGFLQNTGSWILFPKSLSFEISDDGKNFRPYATYKNTFPIDDLTEVIKDFSIKKSAKARYIKVKAEYPGVLPEWHAGKGEESFIFIDEIWVK
jgi:hypothetical protein